jgi:hypothetical protein
MWGERGLPYFQKRSVYDFSWLLNLRINRDGQYS